MKNQPNNRLVFCFIGILSLKAIKDLLNIEGIPTFHLTLQYAKGEKRY